jgi:hypothetical protein
MRPLFNSATPPTQRVVWQPLRPGLHPQGEHDIEDPIPQYQTMIGLYVLSTMNRLPSLLHRVFTMLRPEMAAVLIPRLAPAHCPTW